MPPQTTGRDGSTIPRRGRWFQLRNPFARWTDARLDRTFAALVVLVVVLSAIYLGHVSAYRIDLDVYRIGARVLLRGGELYGSIPRTQVGVALPFTYPPIAAGLLVPLGVAPYAVANVVLTTATIAATAATIWLVGCRLVPGLDVRRRRTLGASCLVLALLGEPVRSTLTHGQVNSLLMALVALDVLVESPRWPRGVLVGFAAAVKLTPAVFLLLFLLRRDRRSLAMAAISFLGWTAIGAVLAPRDSLRFWTSTVWQSGRPGILSYAGNQSFVGVLARLGVSGPGRSVCWVLLSALALVACVAGMRRALAAGETAWALCLNALLGLLVSPVSWSHHWVWVSVIVLALPFAAAGRSAWRWLGLWVPVLLIIMIGPQWLLPHGTVRELQWSWWEQLLGDSYVLWAMGVLLLAAFGVIGPSRRVVRAAGALRSSPRPRSAV